MIDLIRGLQTPPWVVGFVRGLVETVVIAGLLYVATVLPGLLPPESMFAALIPTVVGFVVGWADQIDPQKKRA